MRSQHGGAFNIRLAGGKAMFLFGEMVPHLCDDTHFAAVLDDYSPDTSHVEPFCCQVGGWSF